MPSQGKEARGLFELVLRFEPRDGSPAAEAETTPGMWGIADEWADSLRAGERPHTAAWVNAKMTDAVFLQAAVDAGLMSHGPITLERIAQMNNLYEVADATPAPEGGEDAGNARPPA